ncbi:SigE family RNA polymerase sigma factor [Motilibacter aurantiacus]|uniref:SigE family RNA polymerase sigma factor n=1 Tax=Motilibacter aurantiacus TaxID=2714955 RepID=UPI00140A1565|nr:SigE family RNA polymerase sigma factor [Motilibacter aurantiacus]
MQRAGADGSAATGPRPPLDEPSAWSPDEAVTALYTAHYRSLVRLGALLLDDVAVAEEVVQDAFVALHGRWRRMRDPDRALAYLRTTVVNRSRSALRRRSVARRHAEAQPPPAPLPSAEDAVLAAAEASRVVAAVRRLPARQREAVVLRYWLDLPEAGVAEAMGISRGAVKSHTSRAMAAIRAALGEAP